MSESSNYFLTKIIRAVPKRSEGELQDVVGENSRERRRVEGHPLNSPPLMKKTIYIGL